MNRYAITIAPAAEPSEPTKLRIEGEVSMSVVEGRDPNVGEVDGIIGPKGGALDPDGEDMAVEVVIDVIRPVRHADGPGILGQPILLDSESLGHRIGQHLDPQFRRDP